MLCLVAQSCLTLCDPMNCSPPGSSVHGDSPGKATGVGCHALLQGSSQSKDGTQVSPLQVDSLLSEPPRKSKNTGVDYPFSRGTSPPRNWTRVSCGTGRFFTSWALYPFTETLTDQDQTPIILRLDYVCSCTHSHPYHTAQAAVSIKCQCDHDMMVLLPSLVRCTK